MKRPGLIQPMVTTLMIQCLPLQMHSQILDSRDNSKPNILFIYADDWGWGDLGCHGHPEIKTPHLDQLAKEGIDFHKFAVLSPVCSPSRAAILTGQYPSRHSIHTAISTQERNAANGMPNWLDPNATLLPRLLRDAGYTTGHFGKWHLSLHGNNITDETPLPQEYGYDESAVWTGPGRTVWENSSYADKEGRAFHPVASSYLTAAAVEQAIRFISGAGDKPFYVNLWIHETHTFISATEEDRQAYPDHIPEPQRTYYSAVSRADRLIGELLQKLDDLGKSENTIVIFSSDNGPEDQHPDIDHVRYFSVGSTGGLRGRKRSLYLGGVNTPFIVRWPGLVPAGRVDTSSVIAGVDMLPTFLSAAGIPLPPDYELDGVNIIPALKGEKFERDKPLFWKWIGPHHTSPANWPELSVMDGDWVLLWARNSERVELYNIVNDRGQENNLARKYPDRTERMKNLLKEWEATLPLFP